MKSINRKDRKDLRKGRKAILCELCAFFVSFVVKKRKLISQCLIHQSLEFILYFTMMHRALLHK